MKELGDRLDGKAAQSVALSGDLGFEVTKIERVIVHPKNPDS